jgi:hypothetical protein
MNKIYLLWLLVLPHIFSNACAQEKGKTLFNGKDLTGWHWDVPDMDTDACKPWTARGSPDNE